MKTPRFVRVAKRADLDRKGHLVLQVEGHTIALFLHQGSLYAIDNRCLHSARPGQTYQIAYRLHRGERIYEET